jgi:hypothetical protein
LEAQPHAEKLSADGSIVEITVITMMTAINAKNTKRKILPPNRLDLRNASPKGSRLID